MSPMQDVIPDDWLSQVCGRACFRVSDRIAASPDLATRLTDAARGGDAFFYLRLPVDAAQPVTQAVRSGFLPVDTGLTLEYAGGETPAPAIPVAIATPDQARAAAGIAATGFRYSRFHLDPLFPRDLADRIKQAWIESYAAGRRGEALYVAGAPDGFLAVLVADDGRTAVIDLIAVAERAARRGIGRALVRHFIATWQDKTERLRVGTQAANTASLQLYESCGFRIAAANHVLHAHLRNGKIVS